MFNNTRPRHEWTWIESVFITFGIWGLAIIAALLMSGCFVAVKATPQDCLNSPAPDYQCEEHYVWVNGYMWRDGWGAQHWQSGGYHYRPGHSHVPVFVRPFSNTRLRDHRYGR